MKYIIPTISLSMMVASCYLLVTTQDIVCGLGIIGSVLLGCSCFGDYSPEEYR